MTKLVLIALVLLSFVLGLHAQNLVLLPKIRVVEITDSTFSVINEDRLISRTKNNDSLFYTISILKNDSLLKQSELTTIPTNNQEMIVDVRKLLLINSGTKTGNSTWTIQKSLKHSDSTYSTKQNQYFSKSLYGSGILEIFSIRKYDGLEYALYREYFDFHSDSLLTKLYLKTNTNSSEPFQFIITLLMGDKIVFVRRLSSKLSDSLNAISFPIGKLPNKMISGGKCILMVEGYSSDKKLVFSFDQIPIYIKGLQTPEKNTSSLDDPYFLDSYTDKEIGDLAEISSLFANSTEQRILESTQSKISLRRFLTKFWQNREKKYEEFTPTFSELQERIKQAIALKLEYLGTTFWHTDRGRILLQYGFPDNIEKEPFGQNNTPLQIWEFNGIEKGVIFVFIDFNKNGEYRLVHSTKTGEINNPKYDSN